ncbi:MAG: hypothetical protein J6N72_10470 [Psychrobacter sp.]|nr:hypothetical protein [Psychrobacter sp.]
MDTKSDKSSKGFEASASIFYNIKCLDCKTHVDARYTTGREVLPDDIELANKHYWICDNCNHYVAGAGARKKYKGQKVHMPVGLIPNDEVKAWRHDVYECFNSLIELGINRKQAYKKVSKALQYSLGLKRMFGINSVNNLREAEDAIAAILIVKASDYEWVDKHSMRKTIAHQKAK